MVKTTTRVRVWSLNYELFIKEMSQYSGSNLNQDTLSSERMNQERFVGEETPPVKGTDAKSQTFNFRNETWWNGENH